MKKSLIPLFRFLTAFSLFWLFISPFAKAEFNGPYDPESISAFVTENNINSVDDFLKELPESLRSQFSLIYDTRNKAQHASHAKPRVLLFSPDGKFYMSFTGSDDVKGGNVVEMISQTDRGDYRFSTLDFEQGKPRIHKDVKSCTGCHGKNPRPIWDGYPKWPGAYGSDHDVLRIDATESTQKRHESFTQNSKELQQLEVLQDSGLSRDRYVHLAGVPRDQSARLLYPYLSNMNMHMSEVVLDSLNREIIGEFLSKPDSAKYLPLLIDTIGQNQGREFVLTDEAFQKLAPDELKEDLPSFRELKDKRSASLKAVGEGIKNRLDNLNPGAHSNGFYYNFASADQDAFSLIEYIGKKVGMSEDFWRPGLQGSIRQTGGSLPAYIVFYNELVEQLKIRDPELAKYVRVKPAGQTFLYEISEKGRARIMANPSLYSGDLPLNFQNTPNRRLEEYLRFIGKGDEASTPKACGGFFQKMLKTIKAGL